MNKTDKLTDGISMRDGKTSTASVLVLIQQARVGTRGISARLRLHSSGSIVSYGQWMAARKGGKQGEETVPALLGVESFSVNCLIEIRTNIVTLFHYTRFSYLDRKVPLLAGLVSLNCGHNS
jgi:hypothetical protein